MKIEPNYAIELLKQLEEIFPERLQKSQLQFEKDKNKVAAHLVYLLDEKLVDMKTSQTTVGNHEYRINSNGINLLNNFDLRKHVTSPS